MPGRVMIFLVVSLIWCANAMAQRGSGINNAEQFTRRAAENAMRSSTGRGFDGSRDGNVIWQSDVITDSSDRVVGEHKPKQKHEHDMFGNDVPVTSER